MKLTPWPLSTMALLAMVCMINGAMAQPPGRNGFEQPQFLFYEAVSFAAGDPALSRVDVLYRIDHDYFVAVRNSDVTFPHEFKRRGEITVELLDSTGESRARHIDRIELGAKTTERTVENKRWYQSAASFTLAPGVYTVVMGIDDLESDRKFLEKRKTVHARKFSNTQFEVSSPLFIGLPDTTPFLKPLVPANFGGNVLYGSRNGVYLQLTSPRAASEPLTLRYSFVGSHPAEDDSMVVHADSLTTVPVAPGSLLTLSRPGADQPEETPRYTFTIAGSETSPRHLIIPLPTEKLPLRLYRLRLSVRQGDLTTTVQHPFSIVWPEMPAALRDPDFALDVLRYITTEDQLDSLKSGGRLKRREHLENFWNEKSRTPNTAYNEVMVQYYRRVDYTMRAFSSLKGGDGYKTDRGRIYILYGPPNRTERKLDPSAGFQEIWVYEGVRKVFSFADRAKSGNYVLVATQDL